MKRAAHGTILTALSCAVLALSGCGALGAAGGTASTSSPAEASAIDWSAQAVSTAADGTTSTLTYTPIPVDKVPTGLTVCVLFPNMADDYWSAVNYGGLSEAKRDGVTYLAYNAGGYDNLQTQLDQIDGCITQKVDAIVIAAISDGACSGVQAAIAAGIPVVDSINGMNCPSLQGNSLFSHVYIGPADYGRAAAQMLVDQKKPLKVALFPGADGTPFVEQVSKSFQEGIAGSDVTLEVEKRGTLTEDAQLSLAEDVLRTYPDVNATIGVTVGGTAAVTAIRNAGRNGQIQAFQYAITKSFYQDIMDGKTSGSVSDVAPLSARMAFDQAVRLAAKVDPITDRRIGPQAKIVTKESASDIPYDTMFAPNGFQLTYNWSPKS